MTSVDLFDTRPKVKKQKSHLPKNPESEGSLNKAVKTGRFPSWLHRKLPKGGNLWKTGRIVEENQLATVCEEAKCPNLLECWSKKTATFLVMGSQCTRSCGFCDIDYALLPKPLEDDEPDRVADSVKRLGLNHVVITMVARDDLLDQGALHLARIIKKVREENYGVTIEVLTSDFNGNLGSLECVLDAKPEIFNHNIETVRELTSRVRHIATYERSFSILEHVKKYDPTIFVKSGIMVGLGESKEQVEQSILDLHSIGCDSITIGQYLQPNKKKLRVKAFITPQEFKEYEEYGLRLGIKAMYCGPFIRSSYNAGEVLKELRK